MYNGFNCSSFKIHFHPFTAYSVYLMTIRLMILVLLLSLTSDQCHGFAEEGLRELCRKLPNTDPASNGSSLGPSESDTFSCGDCTRTQCASNVWSITDPYVCKYCYETEENEAFSCQSCKIGSKSKPFICGECKANPAHDASQQSTMTPFGRLFSNPASQESATGCNIHSNICLQICES